MNKRLYEWKMSENPSKERLSAAFQKLFSTSADEKDDEINSLTESYRKYKRNYVKHLQFNLNNENLSEYNESRTLVPPDISSP